MQKKLIALAVAGLASTAAFAQSNVTMYGVGDIYVGRMAVDGKKTATVVNSGGLATSRIGVKGVEDLGNGLKAVVVLEYRLDMDDNYTIGGSKVGAADSAGPARQQLLGLAGDFGTVAAGRLQTAAYDWAVKYDVLAGTAISPLQYVNGTNFNVGATTADARANNALAYISNNLNGLTLAANYSFAVEESATNAQTDKKIGATLLSANYENGPLAVGAVYDAHSSDVNSYAVSRTQSGKDFALGGSYNFGAATLKATYQTSKTADATGVAGNTDKAYSVGLVAPVSATGTVIASYAKSKYDTSLGTDAKSFTVAYTQALSKRTTAYAGYQSKDSGAATDSKSSALVGGINHKF